MRRAFVGGPTLLLALFLAAWTVGQVQAQDSLPFVEQLDGAPLEVGPPAFDVPDGFDGACNPCEPPPFVYHPRFPRFWVRGEYLLWWTKGMEVPPLVTTSPDGTPQERAGVLGDPQTTILYGGESLFDSSRSGGQISAGVWLSPCYEDAIEGSYLWLGEASDPLLAASGGSPILARPFLDAQSGQPSSELVALRGVVQGTVSVDATSDFQAAELLYRRALCCGCEGRVDFLIGYRFAQLKDSLLVSEALVSADPDTQGATLDLYDRFDTQNQFNGAELGMSGRYRWSRWTLELLGKLALGNTRSDITIDGATVTSEAPGPVPGGLLALPSNIGAYQANHFSVLPELRATLGYQITCRLRAVFGYTLLYWSQVVRPGDQIDLFVNPSQLPPPDFQGAPLPAFRFATTDFWAQGMHFGLEYNF